MKLCTNDACVEMNLEHERITCETPNKNAHIESFHRLLQEEFISENEYLSYAEAYKSVYEI